jgi:hypothetical protein
MSIDLPSVWVAQVMMFENFPSPAAVKAATWNKILYKNETRQIITA